MGKARKRRKGRPAWHIARGAAAGIGGGAVRAGALFVVIFVSLFFMIVGVACAHVGVETTLESGETFEKVLAIPVAALVALVAAAIASFVFSAITAAVSAGYQAVLAAKPTSGGRAGALLMVGVALGMGALGGTIGWWRLSAGIEGGEAGWTMQGVVVAAVSIIAALLLLLPNLWLSIRPGTAAAAPPPKGQGGGRKGDKGLFGEATAKGGKRDELNMGAFTFMLLATFGIIASFGVVHWVDIARAQAGRVPMPLGVFVHGWVQDEDSEGYPKKAELIVPAGIKGKHTITWIDVSPCPLKLLDDDGKAVKTKRTKVEEDRPALLFKADPDKRYRVAVSLRNNDDCMYTVRLQKKRGSR